MDKTGLRDKVYKYVDILNLGRKGLTIDGQEHEGHVAHDEGLKGIMALLTEVRAEKDLEAMIITENAYIREELALCDAENKAAIASMTRAVASFDDALRALEAVEESGYKTAEKTYPRNTKYRVKGNLPKDALHSACIANKTRIKSFISAPGINPVLYDLSVLRIEMMQSARDFYAERQVAAINNA